ncbi:MAG: hypothetical protein JKY20_12345 [Alphaproteobacteria bacterium]|nr:hypothetical protein [Alphaproteobacteria bacterium]
MSLQILDPTHEGAAREFALAPRQQTLEGMTIGVISNGKKSTKPFFDAMEKELIETYGVATVVRRIKSNYSAPAESEILEEAKQWDALIAGIGD